MGMRGDDQFLEPVLRLPSPLRVCGDCNETIKELSANFDQVSMLYQDAIETLTPLIEAREECERQFQEKVSRVGVLEDALKPFADWQRKRLEVNALGMPESYVGPLTTEGATFGARPEDLQRAFDAMATACDCESDYCNGSCKRRDVSCMVCDREIPTDARLSFLQRASRAVRDHQWASSEGAHGFFLCCPTCYPAAFDLSKGGNVGFLRDGFRKFARPKERGLL